MKGPIFFIGWVCSNCGHIHSGLADSSEQDFEERKKRFVDDCQSKNEPYQIIPLELVENAQRVQEHEQEETFGSFLQQVLQEIADDDDTIVMPIILKGDNPHLN